MYAYSPRDGAVSHVYTSIGPTMTYDEKDVCGPFSSNFILTVLIDCNKNVILHLQQRFESEIKNMEDKFTIMKIYNRRMNLLFYGIVIEEKPNENVYAVLKENGSYHGINELDANNIALVNAHRLPSRRVGERRGPNAIIAKFVYMHDRERVLHSFEDSQRHLCGTL